MTGCTKFIDRLQGKAAIGIVTIGERPTSIAERTTDVEALKKGVTRIFARPGTGAYLLEGIVDVSRGFQKREAARPVIVAITIEGIEYSNAGSTNACWTSFTRAARRCTCCASAPPPVR